MTDTQILCFLETANTLSFTRAAQELFLSQQAVSKYVSSLEKELGLRLFERGAALCLTEAGEHYERLFSQALSELDDIYKNNRARNEKLRAQYRLGLSEWLDPFGRLGDALSGFYRANPYTHFQIEHNTNDAILSGLLEGRLCAALFSEGQKPNHRDVEAVPVAWEDMRLFAPAGSVASFKADDGWRECWGEPLFMTSAWEWSPLESKQISSRECDDIGLAPHSVELLPNLASILAEMHMGRGSALSDANFSMVARVPGLDSHKLPVESRLLCVRRMFDENPLTDELCDYLTDVFSFSEN